MLTSFMVTCPNFDCNWSGSLLPRGDSDSWRGALPTISVVVFECPQCHEEWRARVVGDEVVALPHALEDPLPFTPK